MEDVKRHVQTLMVASPVPVQMVLYWIQMALIVMVSSISVYDDIYSGTSLISLYLSLMIKSHQSMVTPFIYVYNAHTLHLD